MTDSRRAPQLGAQLSLGSEERRAAATAQGDADVRHTRELLAVSINCIWDEASMLQTLAPPLSQLRDFFPIFRDTQMNLFRAIYSFTAALLIQSSVLANLLCIMQIPKISAKPKYNIFNPFNLSAKEPYM